jgi:hypothetical protein
MLNDREDEMLIDKEVRCRGREVGGKEWGMWE